MAMLQAKQPFELLRDIETRSRQRALSLPQQRMSHMWSAIAFKMARVNLLVEMEDINEIIGVPELTRVPGAQYWIRGLANLRGALVPIMDLRGTFIRNANVSLDGSVRIFVIRQSGLIAGLVVDEVFGIRHFFDEDKSDQIPDIPSGMRDYILSAYRKQDKNWAVFSFKRSAESPQFLQIATRI